MGSFDSSYLTSAYGDIGSTPYSYDLHLSKYLLSKISLSQSRLVADFGCGHGRLLKAFSSYFCNHVGLDLHYPDLAYDSWRKEWDFIDLSPLFMFLWLNSFQIHLSILRSIYLSICNSQFTRSRWFLIVITPSWKHSALTSFYDDYTHCRPYTKHHFHVHLNLHLLRSNQ